MIIKKWDKRYKNMRLNRYSSNYNYGGKSMEMKVGKQINTYKKADMKDVLKGIRRTNKKYAKAMANLAK